MFTSLNITQDSSKDALPIFWYASHLGCAIDPRVLEIEYRIRRYNLAKEILYTEFSQLNPEIQLDCINNVLEHVEFICNTICLPSALFVIRHDKDIKDFLVSELSSITNDIQKYIPRDHEEYNVRIDNITKALLDTQDILKSWR